MNKFRDAMKRVLEQTREAAQQNIPAGNIRDQVRGGATGVLPPGGNTGTGYTPGDGSVTTAKLADDAATFAKMQNIATDRLIGRDTAGTGDPEQLTASGGVEFTGSGGIQRSALTGDVTASAGSGSTTIPNDTVTYAKMQNVSAASKLLGRGDSGSGDPQEITLGTGLSMSGTTLSSSGGGGSSLTVEEVDGNPTDSAVTKIVFPNSTLAIASHVATYTPAASAPVGATYITQTHDATLSAEQALADLATGILKSTTTTGVLSIATGADLPTMVASGASHSAGAVPDPGSSAGTTKFLREDASWETPSGTGAPTDVPYITTTSSASLSAEVVIPGLAGSADIAGAGGAGFAEEFDGAAGSWSWSTNPTTFDSNTTVKSCYYARNTAADNFPILTRSWSPSGAYDIRCKLSVGFDGASTNGLVYFRVVDSAGNNGVELRITRQSGTALGLDARSLSSGTATSRATLASVMSSVYLRLTRDGSNNNSWYWSSDGLTWNGLAIAFSLTFTAAKVQLILNTSNTSFPVEFACDWVRANV